MNQYFVFWWTDSHEPKSAVIMAEDNLAAAKEIEERYNCKVRQWDVYNVTYPLENKS
ncbi:MAG: hypothetical protein ABI865_13745 [Nitrosospira sp.]